MKVLVAGRPQKGKAKEYRCTGGRKNLGCGALLLVEEGDVVTYKSTDYTGGTDTNAYFVCASCGVKTFINPYDFD